jgi:hypothetical protein
MVSIAEKPINIAQDTLAAFQSQRQQMIALASRTAAVLRRLEIESKVRQVVQVQSRLESDHFKIMVFGEFKRGKSALINALLGARVLPEKAVPCTAVISEVKWAEQRRAVLHFRHPLPASLPEDIVPDALAHIRKAKGAAVPPFEVPVERLSDYIAIRSLEKEQIEAVAETPYERVELFWPLELCKNGVEVIDSPGLNEHAVRARITLNYLEQVDAVLFVQFCSPLGSVEELQVIDHDLRDAGHEYLFFVCNCYDRIPEAERPEVRRFALAKLRDRTRLGEGGIFFISALEALEGRLQRQPERVEASGIPPLEQALARFLVRDRGKVKLDQPGRELGGVLAEARDKIIPSQLRMLDDSLVGLNQKYEKAKPMLEDARRRKEQMVKSLENQRMALNLQVRAEAEQMLRVLAAEVPGWADAMQTQEGIKILTLRPQEAVKPLVEEVTEKLRAHMQSHVQEWGKATLAPVIDSWLQGVQAAADKDIDGFYAQIEKVDQVLSSIEAPPDDNPEGVSDKGRMWAAGIGILTNPLGAVAGYRFGFKGLATTLGTQLAAGIALGLLGFGNPVILIGMLAAGILNLVANGWKLSNAVKHKVGVALQNKLREELFETSAEIAGKIDERVIEMSRKTASSLDGEIQAVRERVEVVLKDKQRDESRVTARKKILQEALAEIDDIDSALKLVTSAVAGA